MVTTLSWLQEHFTNRCPDITVLLSEYATFRDTTAKQLLYQEDKLTFFEWQ